MRTSFVGSEKNLCVFTKKFHSTLSVNTFRLGQIELNFVWSKWSCLAFAKAITKGSCFYVSGYYLFCDEEKHRNVLQGGRVGHCFRFGVLRVYLRCSLGHFARFAVIAIQSIEQEMKITWDSISRSNQSYPKSLVFLASDNFNPHWHPFKLSFSLLHF